MRFIEGLSHFVGTMEKTQPKGALSTHPFQKRICFEQKQVKLLDFNLLPLLKQRPGFITI